MRISSYSMLIEEGRPYLVKESARNIPEIQELRNPEQVYELFKKLKVTLCAEEHVYMLALNTKCRVIGLFEISHGTVNECMVSPREVLIRALLCGAAAIFLVHNHPSGDSQPSTMDTVATKRMHQACKMIGIELLDHIIVGDHYYSFLENGGMENE